MRKTFIILTSVILTSCFGGLNAGLNDEPFEAESRSDEKLTDLQGTWFCVRTDVVASDRREELDFEEELKSYKENMELNVFKFIKDRFIMSTRSEPRSIIDTKWNFVPSNRINFPKMEEYWSFIINYLNKDSMNLDIIPPFMAGSDGVRINCKMVKLNMKELGDVDIFDPSINSWRNMPDAPQTSEEIRKTLRGLLNYNNLYIRFLYYSSATYVNTKVFNLPFRYYNGGIGLEDKLADNDPFVRLFHTKDDAYTALQMLRKAFHKTEYERKTNYVLEYAAFMKGLSENL